MFDFGDVRSIVIQCSECGGRTSVPPEVKWQLSKFIACPICETEWFGRDYETAAKPYIDAMRCVERARRLLEDAPPRFAIRLEVDDPC